MRVNDKHNRLRKSVLSVFTAATMVFSGFGFQDFGAVQTVKADTAVEKTVDAASAVNYSSILGRAVDYGIVAGEFTQGNHMETTFATHKFIKPDNGQNNDVDLSEGGTAQFMVGSVAEGTYITLGTPGKNTKTFNIEATPEIFEGFNSDASTDNGVIRRVGQFRDIATIYPKIADKKVIDDNIDRIIDNVAEKSAILSKKANDPSYKLDLSRVNSASNDISQDDGAHFYLDLNADEFENAVVYVNVSDGGTVLANAIKNTGSLHIKKRSSTVVVMNMDEDNDGTGKSTIGKYEVIVCDGTNETSITSDTDHSGNITEHNKAVNKDMAQKIIWNLPNATNVEINISAGAFLIPRKDSNVAIGSSAGWLVTGGKATNSFGEWHYIYEGTSEDTNSDAEGQIHFAARKAFTKRFDGRNTEEDFTVFANGGDYKFHFYETDEYYDTQNAKELIKYDANGDPKAIMNEASNKIKFPLLTFYTGYLKAPAEKSDYVITDGNSKTFYYCIKEEDAGTVKNGVYNSDGEIDIKLTVKNTDGVLTYQVTSVTYLDSAKNEYKHNNNIDMSGIEFSLGAFFNLTNYVEISKRDVTGKNEVPGATLALTGKNSDGKTIIFGKGSVTAGEGAEILSDEGEKLEWVSGTEASPVKNLADGVYTLTETTAPKGFLRAENIEFEVKDGKIASVSGNGDQDGKTVIMIDENENSHVSISKVDANNGSEILGAVLTLEGEDNDGKAIEFDEEYLTVGEDAVAVSGSGSKLEWISGISETRIQELVDGTYTLTEKTAPDGYEKAETVKFIVKNGKVSEVLSGDGEKVGNDKVVMKDKPMSRYVNVSKREVNGSDELPGATLTLTGKAGGADINFAAGVITSSEGVQIKSASGTALEWVSGTKSVSLKNIPDGEYTLTEVAPPDKYEKAENVVFVMENGMLKSVDGSESGFSGNTVIMYDEPKSSHIDISKRDANGTGELAGATLVLTGVADVGTPITFAEGSITAGEGVKVQSQSGNKLEWVSGTTATRIKNLPNGKYTLTELTAPDGYLRAENVVFTVKNGEVADISGSGGGNGNNVVMFDKTESSRITVSKREINKSDELAGALLTLTGTDAGNKAVVFEEKHVILGEGALLSGEVGEKLEWLSGTKPTEIQDLPNGTYTLTETTAPAGYDVAESITFEMNNGKITNFKGDDGTTVGDSTVIMYDKPTESYVDISKKIVNGTNELPGATLTLTGKDNQGKTIKDFALGNIKLGNGANITSFDDQKIVWVSGTSAVRIFALSDGTYTLTETTAPNGYTKAESISFVIQGGKLVRIDGQDNTAGVKSVVMFDDVENNYVDISKREVNGSSELAGATLTLTGKKSDNSDVIFSERVVLPGEGVSMHQMSGSKLEWVSGTTATRIQNLPDAVYTLTETTAPNGYLISENVVFTVSGGKLTTVNGGEISGSTVIMRDASRLEYVDISKQDANDGGEVKGAVLALTGKDASGNEVNTFGWNSFVASGGAYTKTVESNKLVWVSGDEPMRIKDLADGTYTLTEETAPIGYRLAENVTFVISGGELKSVSGKNGKMDGNKVIMLDSSDYVAISKRDVNGSDELPGARLTLTGKYENGETVMFDRDENFISDNGVTALSFWGSVDRISWTSGTRAFKIYNLEDATYTLTEETAPNGYKKAENVTFKLVGGKVTQVLGKDGKWIEESNEVVMIDEPRESVSLSKRDVNGSDELSGAVLILKGTNDGDDIKFYNSNIVSRVGVKDLKIWDGATELTWTSGTDPLRIYDLPDGDYILTEQTAPDGYVIAEDVKFHIKDGKVTDKETKDGKWIKNSGEVIMIDKPREAVAISKRDVNGSDELPGATLILKGTNSGNSITFKTDNIISSDGVKNLKEWNGATEITWTSGTKALSIYDLPDGDYTLTEQTAPDGYMTAENVLFKIKDGKVVDVGTSDGKWIKESNTVVMLDKPKEAVSISKKAVNGNGELAGARLTLKGTDNGDTVKFRAKNILSREGVDIKVFYEGTEEIVWISGTKELQIYDLPDGTYTLKEETAPDKYELAEDVIFNIKDGKVIDVGTSAGKWIKNSNSVVILDKLKEVVPISETTTEVTTQPTTEATTKPSATPKPTTTEVTTQATTEATTKASATPKPTTTEVTTQATTEATTKASATPKPATNPEMTTQATTEATTKASTTPKPATNPEVTTQSTTEATTKASATPKPATNPEVTTQSTTEATTKASAMPEPATNPEVTTQSTTEATTKASATPKPATNPEVTTQSTTEGNVSDVVVTETTTQSTSEGDTAGSTEKSTRSESEYNTDNSTEESTRSESEYDTANSTEESTKSESEYDTANSTEESTKSENESDTDNATTTEGSTESETRVNADNAATTETTTQSTTAGISDGVTTTEVTTQSVTVKDTDNLSTTVTSETTTETVTGDNEYATAADEVTTENTTSRSNTETSTENTTADALTETTTVKSTAEASSAETETVDNSTETTTVEATNTETTTVRGGGSGAGTGGNEDPRTPVEPISFDLTTEVTTSVTSETNTSSDNVTETTTSTNVGEETTTDVVTETATSTNVGEETTTDVVTETATSTNVGEETTTDVVTEVTTSTNVGEETTTDVVTEVTTSTNVGEETTTDVVTETTTGTNVGVETTTGTDVAAEITTGTDVAAETTTGADDATETTTRNGGNGGNGGSGSSAPSENITAVHSDEVTTSAEENSETTTSAGRSETTTFASGNGENTTSASSESATETTTADNTSEVSSTEATTGRGGISGGSGASPSPSSETTTETTTDASTQTTTGRSNSSGEGNSSSSSKTISRLGGSGGSSSSKASVSGGSGEGKPSGGSDGGTSSESSGSITDGSVPSRGRVSGGSDYSDSSEITLDDSISPMPYGETFYEGGSSSVGQSDSITPSDTNVSSDTSVPSSPSGNDGNSENGGNSGSEGVAQTVAGGVSNVSDYSDVTQVGDSIAAGTPASNSSTTYKNVTVGTNAASSVDNNTKKNDVVTYYGGSVPVNDVVYVVNGNKLPQTGSPVNTDNILGFGAGLMLLGALLLKRRKVS